jgi:putative endonuclease
LSWASAFLACIEQQLKVNLKFKGVVSIRPSQRTLRATQPPYGTRVYMAWMYILECCDGSYYVGSTKNLERRLSEHQQGLGARYTTRRLPVKLVYCEVYDRVSDAFYREKQVQGWRRAKREALINGDPQLLPALAKKVFDRSKIDKVNLVDGKLGG